VYANRPTIVDFSDAEDLRPHLDIRLLQGDSDVTEYPLRTAAFANINSLSIFLVRAKRAHIRITDRRTNRCCRTTPQVESSPACTFLGLKATLGRQGRKPPTNSTSLLRMRPMLLWLTVSLKDLLVLRPQLAERESDYTVHLIARINDH
jgi:hypothetical protein